MISAFRPILQAAASALCAGCLVSGGAASSGAQETFYKSKRLSLVVNGAAGGPSDIEGRLFAKHIARHLGTGLGVLVQNMDGAGGLVGTNYIGEVAPRDGTVAGYFSAAAWTYATDPEKFRVDFRTYEFVAYQPGTTVYYVRSDVHPDMKIPADITKAQGLVAGGLAADNPKDLLIRLALDLLGVPYKYVTGYRSVQAARLALQRSEINYFAESPPGYRSIVLPGLVRDGVVLPLYYDPGYDGERFAVPRQVDGLGLAPFQELYRTVKGTSPSGQLWDVYLATLTINSDLQRLLVMPPDAPQAAVADLRAAIAALDRDKAFAEDTLRTIGYVPEFVAEPATNKHVRNALAVRPEIRNFVSNYIKAGKN